MLQALLLVVFFSLTGCGPGQSGVKCDEWPPIPFHPASTIPEQSFSSVEGRFKIGLPPTLAEKPQSYDGPNGHIETTRYEWVVRNHGQYGISYSDSDRIFENATDNGRVLDKLRELLLSKGGHLESDLELRLAGHPGREIRIKDGSGMDIQRFYLVGRRMYTVGAFVPNSRLECALESVVKVLDSFELVETSPPRNSND